MTRSHRRSHRSYARTTVAHDVAMLAWYTLNAFAMLVASPFIVAGVYALLHLWRAL